MSEDTKPVCGLCGSEEVDVNKDIGSDIDPSGEERQHLNRCRKCGATQFWVDRWEDFNEHKVHHGKWEEKGGYWDNDPYGQYS